MSEIYQRFAKVYSQSHYPEFSKAILNLIPGLLEQYNLPAKGKLLDLACGEGTFLEGMSLNGWQVTGLDQSAAMLKLAEKRLKSTGRPYTLLHSDMRDLSLENEFDLVTCWFDSLNYLLEAGDIEQVFSRVFRALKPNGGFLFDMNTLYGLFVRWQQQPMYISQEKEDVLEIHIPSCDYELGQASLRIILFLKEAQSNSWERWEEIHTQKAYPMDFLQSTLEKCGFRVLARLANLAERTPAVSTSGRVWFIAQKPD